MTNPGDQRFPAKYRLKLKRDFERVFKEGLVAADGVLVIHALRNELEFSRIGISIGRKYGKANQRNLFKRWCRESFRTQRLDLPTGLDLIVRAKAHGEPDFDSVCKSMASLMKRLDRKLQRA
jgi:ribonuclease P protein component